jgi:hypothetical protein
MNEKTEVYYSASFLFFSYNLSSYQNLLISKQFCDLHFHCDVVVELVHSRYHFNKQIPNSQRNSFSAK